MPSLGHGATANSSEAWLSSQHTRLPSVLLDEFTALFEDSKTLAPPFGTGNCKSAGEPGQLKRYLVEVRTDRGIETEVGLPESSLSPMPPDGRYGKTCNDRQREFDLR
jgi:hypothetical protein